MAKQFYEGYVGKEVLGLDDKIKYEESRVEVKARSCKDAALLMFKEYLKNRPKDELDGRLYVRSVSKSEYPIIARI